MLRHVTVPDSSNSPTKPGPNTARGEAKGLRPKARTCDTCHPCRLPAYRPLRIYRRRQGWHVSQVLALGLSPLASPLAVFGPGLVGELLLSGTVTWRSMNE